MPIPQSFFGNYSDQANGEQFISFGGPVDVHKAIFASAQDLLGRDDFSVAGFTRYSPYQGPTNSVPDGGSSLGLLGIGLLGLTALRNKLRTR